MQPAQAGDYQVRRVQRKSNSSDFIQEFLEFMDRVVADLSV